MNAAGGADRFRGMRLLATAFDFRPRLGGIATLSYELLASMRRDWGVDVRVLAPAMPGAAEFDAGAGLDLDTRRLKLPGAAYAAAAPLAAALAGEVAHRRADAVLNTLWLPGGLASTLVAPVLRARGTRHYVYAHGVEIIESDWNFRKRLRRALVPVKRGIFRGAAGVFTNSAYTRGLVADACGVDPSRVTVAYPGVDPARFSPRPAAPDLVERHGLAGRRVLVTISRLEDYKGVDRVIAAMREVVARHPDALYLVCGEGPDSARLERLVRHYRLGDHVRFAGRVPAERLADYYALGEAFVMLSRESDGLPNVEGFGLVYLEAAACGRPSIGGASGGVPEAVGAPECGWVVDPTDDRAIARAVSEALDDPAGTRARGAAALARARAEFGWSTMAGRMLEVMANVRN